MVIAKFPQRLLNAHIFINLYTVEILTIYDQANDDESECDRLVVIASQSQQPVLCIGLVTPLKEHRPRNDLG